jgi:hypothetical protein
MVADSVAGAAPATLPTTTGKRVPETQRGLACLGLFHDGIDLAWTLVRLLLSNEVPMPAQIILLSDYRKVRPPPMPCLISVSFSIFVGYFVIGFAIHKAIIEAAPSVCWK